jgi:hypothetical protein
VISDTRYCGRCRVYKAELEFYTRDSYCKDCRKAASDRTRRKNAKHYSLMTRLRRYKLSLADYALLFGRACGRCECCGAEFVEEPHIEHNHATGVVRGLVCRRCNYAIAVAENPQLLENALAWIARP